MWLTSRPLLAWHNRSERRDGLPLTTRADLHRQARQFPTTGEAFAAASMARTLAWAFTLLVGLAVYIATAFVRNWTDTWHHPVPVVVMTAAAAITMFAGGALMVSAARWSLSWWQEDALDRAFTTTPPGRRRPAGALVRLCTPSHGDAVFAALWSLLLTPEVYGSVVAAAPG